MAQNETLFPAIGSLAVKTDETSEIPVRNTDDAEDKVVQEVNSLCMNCHQQVSFTR